MKDWVTLRELDGRAGTVKGSAFRAFKHLSAGWREGTDYRVLMPEADAQAIEALRAAGRIYASSRSVVLLARSAAERVAQALASGQPRE